MRTFRVLVDIYATHEGLSCHQLFVAFACNANFLFFFFSSWIHFWTDFQKNLFKIDRLLPMTDENSTNPIYLEKLKDNCVSNVSEDAIWDACDSWHVMCFNLSTVISIHSKVPKNIHSQTRRKMPQKKKIVDCTRHKQVKR